ncbi:MAG: anhydro-N-acetylmuramic acid kinase, partial [Candidatus Tumulicola sp.]
MLLDAFVRARTGGAMPMDRGGALAAAGRVDAGVLAAMLSDPYFAQPPPKSTGRERFGDQFLAAHQSALANLTLEDGLATLAELTAATLTDAVRARGFSPASAFVAGGGTRNRHVMGRIAARLSPLRVETTDAMGIPAEAKEAIGFAVLGYETLRGRASNVPRATGAARAVPLGAIAPYRLHELLAEVERECAASP